MFSYQNILLDFIYFFFFKVFILIYYNFMHIITIIIKYLKEIIQFLEIEFRIYLVF